MIRKLLLITVLSAASLFAGAQTGAQKQFQIGALLSVDYLTYVRSVASQPKDCNCTGAQLDDSLSKQDAGRLGLSFGVNVNFNLNRKWILQTGLVYVDKGFERTRKDLQYGDLVHPSIGYIYDLSSTGSPKNAVFTYKFQYLTIPVIFNKLLPVSKRLRDLDFLFSFGVSADILVKHNFKAVMEGFSVNGSNQFNITETGMHPRGFNATLMLGGRVEYLMEKI